jgi:hypothetical protein
MRTKIPYTQARTLTRQLHGLTQANGGSLKMARFLVHKRSVNATAAKRGIDSLKKAFILKQKLDMARYGVSQLPEHMYSTLLHLDSFRMQKVFRTQLLKPIENANARRILLSAFPQWRQMGQVYGVVEARTVLAKVEYLVKQGRVPFEKYLRQYSLERLRKIAPRIEPIDPKLREIILSRIRQARRGGLSPKELKAVFEKLKQREGIKE